VNAARLAGAAASAPTQAGGSPPGPLYIYGITTCGAAVPSGLRGTGHPAGPVALVGHGAIAAIISRVRADQPLGAPADARAHANVLAVMAQAVPVLPMRFGAVMPDEDAIVAGLLAPHHDSFAASLARLDGHQQFTIKGKYIGDVALREVLAAEPEAMRLRELLRGRDSDVYRQESIRLGELVVRALERKRLADLQTLVDAVAPYAAAVVPRAPSAAEGAVDAAFLVRRPQRSGFEHAAEDLARSWRNRIRLRLLGPLAPYDFAGTLPGGR
jgi:Gas vesicle synthesis protein GvpL/GvpF